MSEEGGNRRFGGAVAPDATEEEQRTVAEVMAAGPQPQVSAADRVAQLAREIDAEDRQPPDISEIAAEVREHREDRQRDEDRERKSEEIPFREAQAALELMLAAEAAPSTETAKFTIPRLARHFGSEEFIVVVRGLDQREYERLQHTALREPTAREKDQGQVGLVQDRNELNRLIVAGACVDPDFRDKRMLRAYGPTPKDIVNKWFTSGEVAMLTSRIMELTGFSDEAVLRAKE